MVAEILEKLLLVFAVLDAVLAADILVRKKWKSAENRWAAGFAFFSAIWSASFSQLVISQSAESARICRSVGMAGMFLAMVCVTFLFTSLARLPMHIRLFFRGISVAGLPIYPFNIRTDYIVFYKTNFGMTYRYVTDIWSTLFLIYTFALLIIFLTVILYMFFNLQKERYKKMAKFMIMALASIAAGNVLDTVLPMMGTPAVPASTVMCFPCVVITYILVDYVNKTKVCASNISDYVFESAGTAILVYDERARLILVSREASRLLDINCSTDFSDIHLDDIFDWEVEPFPASEKVKKFEANARRKDLRCNIEIHKILDDYNDLVGFIVFLYDMTERAHFIKELQQAREKADAANAAKSAFLANMSHEIRTPINTVLGMNEMIRRECNSPENILKYSEDIRCAGENLLSIINDILDFSKVEAGMMEICGSEYMLKPMLTGVINMFTLKAVEKGLEFYADVDRDIPCRLYGDEVRIRQVLINLLSNAVKYTPYGSVKLKVSGTNRRETCELVFEIIDTGIGIRKEDLGSLFRSFSRLDERQTHHIEGTGLGLSIVKELTRLMNGKLEVESEYQHGSTFRFIISQKIVDEEPVGVLSDNEVCLVQPEYKERFIAPLARMLVVDDNVMNLEVIKGLLKKTEINIETAESGSEFLEMVKKKQYHIILLDHMMPFMDGVEALKKFKELGEENLSREAVVIALTANAVHGAKEYYLGEGFDGYLSKPVQCAELEEMICQMLPGELISTPPEAENKEEGDNMSNQADPRNILLGYGINLKNGLNYCASMDIYKLTASTFCEMAEDACRKLDRYREAADVDNYRIEIHGIKSNARTLGCSSLFEYALDQENKCKENKFEDVIKDGSKPEEMIRRLCAGLKAAFDFDADEELVYGEDSLEEGEALTGENAESAAEESEAPDDFITTKPADAIELSPEVREKIASAINALQDFDAEYALELLDELDIILKDTRFAKTLKACRAKLSVYDYDSAAASLDKIMQ